MRSVLDSEEIYSEFPDLYSVPAMLEMDYSKIINKPFFHKSIAWSTTNSAFNTIDNINFPSAVITSNALLKVPFASSVLFRAKACVVVQVSGTPMHQGTLLVSVLPRGFETPNTIAHQDNFAAPHALLSANESTSACIEIPFYVNTKLSYCDVDGSTLSMKALGGLDYATITTMVLNPLAAPTSASVNVSVSYYIMFKEVEFYVPHADITWIAPPTFVAEASIVNNIRGLATDALDTIAGGIKGAVSDFIDVGRGVIKQYTGLHNPNYPVIDRKVIARYTNQHNSIDCQTKYEKMDPYSGFIRTTNDYTFDTPVDEMDILYHIMKPQYIGTFKVKAADPSGTLCWSRPIGPYQTANMNGSQAVMTTNLERFAYLSKYWKGSLKLHIHASMSNFHFCKLSVTRNYSPVKDSLTKIPTYSNLSNLMVDTLEFAGGGQIQTVELPFISPFNELSTTLDWRMLATQMGIYYIHLQSPLVVNGAVTSDINFNVFISACDDFQFYGHSINPVLTDVRTGVPTAFEAESAVPIGLSDPTDVQIEANQYDGKYLDASDHRPIISVRDHARRMTQVYSAYFNKDFIINSLGVITLDVGRLVGLNFPYVAEQTPGNLHMLNRLFFGYDGGYKFKVVLHGAFDAKVFYIPPGMAYNLDDNALTATTPKPVVGTEAAQAALQAASRMQMIDQNSRYRPLTVFTETSNKFVAVPGAVMIKNAERYNEQMAATRTIIEFEIPNPTNLRFAGSTINAYRPTDPPTVIDYSDEMTVGFGHIGIAMGMLGTQNGTIDDVTSRLGVEVQIFAATTDEGRFGYGVFSPAFEIPSYGAGTPAVAVMDGMQFHAHPNGTPPRTGFVTNPRTIIPGAFYTKTT